MIAVILAAGLSKRFGGKKLLEKINNKPMILYTAELVGAYEFQQKVLVYSDEEVKNTVQASALSSEFIFVHNTHAEEGLSTSIKLAVETLFPLNAENLDTNTESNNGIMFFVGDQPFLNEGTVRRLNDAFTESKGSIIVPVYGADRGNPVIFSTKWVEELKRLKGDVGGRIIIRQNSSEVWEVPITDAEIGRDIDTKEEYNAVQAERISELHGKTE